MFLKAHLTSHSRMSGSRWTTTPLLLSGSLRHYLDSSSVYSFYLLLISSTSVRSLPYLSFIVPILAWSVLLMSPIFLKSSLIFPILLFSSIPLHCSLRRLSYLSLLFSETLFGWVYLSLSPLPLASLLSAICKTSSDNHFAFLHLFSFEIVLVTDSCTILWISVHNSSGTLVDLIPWIHLSSPLYSHKGFDLGHTWMV